jgi:dihydroflavonol-4-reductase
VSLTAVRMARKRMYFSASKAVRELGLPQTDIRIALGDAAAWFAQYGYAPLVPRRRPAPPAA